MTLADLHFLVFGIAGDFDHLHPVPQRTRNLLGVVGGGDEENLRKIVGDVEEVIGERAVLLGIENLEHRRRRVAAVIGRQLVDLVEQDDRVDRAGSLHRVDDATRHRTDVGPAVAPDLGLVANATEAHPDELAPHRLGHGAAQAGLADARRSDETEDLRGCGCARRKGELAHSQELDDALLDRLQPVVIFVEDALGFEEVNLIRRLLVPWEREHGFEVCPDDGRFGGYPWHPFEPDQLAFHLLTGVERHPPPGDLGPEVVELVAFLAAQFLVDYLELLAEVILALRLVHLIADAVANLLLQLEHFELAGEVGAEMLEADQRIECLQKLLPGLDLVDDLGCQQVGEMSRIGCALDHVEHFVRDEIPRLGELAGEMLHMLDQERRLIRVPLRFRKLLDGGHEERPGVLDGAQANPVHPFEHDLEIAAWLSIDREDVGERPDIEQVGCPRIINIPGAVGGDRDRAIAEHRFLDRMDRVGPDRQEGDHIAWEDDDVLQGQQRRA